MPAKRTVPKSLIASGTLMALLLAAALGFAANEPAANTPTTGETGTYDAMFQRLDADRDGYVGRDEAAKQAHFADAFNEADADHDGKLSPDEFKRAHTIYSGQRVAWYAKDSVITAKVKAALVKDSLINALDVSVETAYGEVLLSGFVDDAKQAERARQIATQVEGVKQVHDKLVVKR